MACGSGQTRLGALAQDHELWFDTRRTDTACAACNYGEHRRKLTAPPSARSRRHTAPLTPALLRRQPALQLETLETPHVRPSWASSGRRARPWLVRATLFALAVGNTFTPDWRPSRARRGRASTTPGARSVAPNASPPVVAPTEGGGGESLLHHLHPLFARQI